MRDVIFVGPPGSGKGTVAQIIAGSRLAHHLSTGNLIRRYLKTLPENDPVVLRIAAGDFLSDDETTSIVMRDYDGLLARRIIFDGYPRNLSQAQMLDRISMSRDREIGTVVEFAIDDEAVIERLSGRLTCRDCQRVYHRVINPPRNGFCQCGSQNIAPRPDDHPAVVSARLYRYRHETAPVLDYYHEEGLVRTVDATQTIDVVVNSVLDTIK